MTDSPTDSGSTPKPRGLWSVISHSSSSAPAETGVEPNRESQVEEPAAAAPQGLFAIMRRAEAAEATVTLGPADRTNKYLVDEALTEPPAQPDVRRESVALPQKAARPLAIVGQVEDETQREGVRPRFEAKPESVREVEAITAATVEPDRPEVADPVLSPQTEETVPILPVIQIGEERLKSSRKAAANRLRQSSICFLCGLSSVGLSALSMRPEVWMSLPSLALGFLAIILGFMTLTGVRLSKLSSFTTIASQAGMLLGTLGMFLGPLAFASLGRDLREAHGNQLTRKHLNVIGKGLQQFHENHAAYPVGGNFVREKSGAFKGQHGWMTFLLPFIGEQALYSRIDQSKPFDAPDNRAAMGHDVEAYFAAGGDRTKIGQGYSVAHFAGLGGDVDDETGVSHAGIFTRDTAVRQADVTDGLANTMIVGEVAGTFAPWGDPENWRTIGRGLNKDVNGFGNAAGTGALFLFGDGSVRMFSNKTDPRLLRQLSSRDGGE